jgi:hypothetical protein
LAQAQKGTTFIANFWAGLPIASVFGHPQLFL